MAAIDTRCGAYIEPCISEAAMVIFVVSVHMISIVTLVPVAVALTHSIVVTYIPIVMTCVCYIMSTVGEVRMQIMLIASCVAYVVVKVGRVAAQVALVVSQVVGVIAQTAARAVNRGMVPGYRRVVLTEFTLLFAYLGLVPAFFGTKQFILIVSAFHPIVLQRLFLLIKVVSLHLDVSAVCGDVLPIVKNVGLVLAIIDVVFRQVASILLNIATVLLHVAPVGLDISCIGLLVLRIRVGQSDSGCGTNRKRKQGFSEHDGLLD